MVNEHFDAAALASAGASGNGGGGSAGAFASAAASVRRRGCVDAVPRSAVGSPQKKCHRVDPAHVRCAYLDAPEMLEDYYLNLLDWSRRNVIVVALARSVYLWNASCGEITKLTELRVARRHCMTSVRWTESGRAPGRRHVGLNEVQLWDASTLKRVRRLRGHQGRVSVLAWHGHQLASGSRDSHGARARRARLGARGADAVEAHAGGVRPRVVERRHSGVGRQRQPDQPVGAGARRRRRATRSRTTPPPSRAWRGARGRRTCSPRAAARPTARFASGTRRAARALNAIDTKSQVCSILWSTHYRELVSSHGFSQNQLIVWQYPSMVKVCELTGHTSRVLHHGHVARRRDGGVGERRRDRCASGASFERRRPSVAGWRRRAARHRVGAAVDVDPLTQSEEQREREDTEVALPKAVRLSLMRGRL
jgi:hypothetical protein